MTTTSLPSPASRMFSRRASARAACSLAFAFAFVASSAFAATDPRPRDPRWTEIAHTPTGQQFDFPPAVATSPALKLASGWEYSGAIEVGWIGGDADERSAQFRTYSDPDNGAHVNTFSFNLREPKTGHYVELTGGAAGRGDQSYAVQVGRVNSWKLRLHYHEIPHVLTDRYRSLWSGVGSGALTLLPGLTPGGTASTAADNAAVAAVVAAQPESTLAIDRKRMGARLDFDFARNWKAYVSYALEDRKGARPLGAVWGNTGGTAPIEIAEPIDYRTQDILAGLLYGDGVNALNLRFTASLFDNRIGTVTFQEPYRIAPPGGVTTTPAAGAYTQGRFDLAPSNTAYNARLEFTRKLPDFHRGLVTLILSAGEWRQDDNLIPYTTIPGITLANVQLLPGGGWDTVGSLSRRTANLKVETRLADLTVSLNPTAALNVKLKGRLHETRNAGDPYLAVNPNAVYTDADATTAGAQTRGLTYNGLTGVWGRLLNDASGNNVLLGNNANPAGNLPIQAPTFDSKQVRFGPTADYRLAKASTLSLALEREVTDRTRRERDRTWEDRAKLGYVNRGLGPVTVRASYDYAQRRGSASRASAYDDLFSSAIFPIPTAAGANVNSWAVRSLGGLRNFDVADRDQHTINLRADTMVRPGLDVGVSAQSREARFPDSSYGLNRQSQRSANLDVSWQPTPAQAMHAFYSWQFGRMGQRTIPNANANLTIGLVTPTGTITPANAIEVGSAAGGLIFPLLSAWSARNEDRNHVVGAGVRQDIKGATLTVDYSYSIGRSRVAYDYTVGGAINAANAVLAGTRMPDIATDIGYLDASLRIPIDHAWAVRLLYRYQRETIRDWHYYGLATTPVVAGNVNNLPTGVLLDAGPTNYRVDWYGAMVQLKF
jgi:hypothetical protein